MFLALSLGAVWTQPEVFAEKRTSRDHEQTALPSDKNFSIGKDRYDRGDYDGAIDSFLQAVYFARNNYHPIANLWLAKAYMQKHEDTKAIESLKKCIEQSLGGVPEAHILLGECYLRNDRTKEAEDECLNAITETLGQNYAAYNLLGKVYEKDDKPEAALSQYQTALGDQPYTYTEAWMNLAECHMKLQHWVQALQAFRAMLTNTKKLVGLDYERCYLDIGICLVAKGDHQGAMDNWHRVLDYNPQNPEAHLQLAMLFDAENHISSAVKEYKAFIRNSGDNMKVTKAKERVAIIEQKLQPELPPQPLRRPASMDTPIEQPRQPLPGESGF